MYVCFRFLIPLLLKVGHSAEFGVASFHRDHWSSQYSMYQCVVCLLKAAIIMHENPYSIVNSKLTRSRMLI
jgi:hypothetical protein